MADPIIRFENVDIVFGPKPKEALALLDRGKSREEIQRATGHVVGVANASLEVEEGEILVLMGLSGSGKSTLLRAVNRLNRVVRGCVSVRNADEWIDPHTCSKRQLRQLRRNSVSMVFQQFGLLPWRSVEENIQLGLELSGYSKRSVRDRVHEQLELVGLLEWRSKQVQELSGGMQQRVGLARAFATQAPILLMDEPYSALDPLIRTRLQDELLDLQKRLRRSIVFVSHDLDEAIKLGNRIAIMEGGRIIQTGSPQQILNRPANDYVADFVAHMNPLAVLKAEDAMWPVGERKRGHKQAALVHASTPLTDVISVLLKTGLPVYVERAQIIIGIIEHEGVSQALGRNGSDHESVIINN